MPSHADDITYASAQFVRSFHFLRSDDSDDSAMSIDGRHNEHPLASPPLWIERGSDIAEDRVARGPADPRAGAG